ncbi:hypothetical protein CEXT_504451, partial [Caerostris extrusa]
MEDNIPILVANDHNNHWKTSQLSSAVPTLMKIQSQPNLLGTRGCLFRVLIGTFERLSWGLFRTFSGIISGCDEYECRSSIIPEENRNACSRKLLQSKVIRQ